MTNIKASTRFDEPVTQESLGQAIVNGRKRTVQVQYRPKTEYAQNTRFGTVIDYGAIQ
jgi:hypothetical protein